MATSKSDSSNGQQPRMFRVRQKFRCTKVEDARTAVHEQLHDQFCHYARLGYQEDVNLHTLASATDGVPDWSLDPT